MKYLVTLCLSLVLVLSGCTAVGPQTIALSPTFEFSELNGVVIPIELIIADERENKDIIGFRNAKNKAPIKLEQSLAKTLGESIQKAMEEQGIIMTKTPEKLTKVQVIVKKLEYSSPNESWVSEVNLNALVTIKIERGKTSMTKNFSAERHQEVATAPNAKYNQKLTEELLTDLFSSVFSNSEIINFLK
ncbi:YajG family lipoprotein [Bermanella sp. R86510]|uniref:YajG family lipoprotein n=1 Tax=unclassified Bermanella TaxID=2627862 RepID=UPI0037C822B0